MAKIEVVTDNNKVYLKGDISFETVIDALKINIFPRDSATKTIYVDFSGIEYADSSGLALMVNWLRQAKKRNVDVQFTHIPKKLIALAGMSNLEQVLPIN